MNKPTFDEAMHLIVNKPAEFRRLCSLNVNLRELRGLHNETLLHFLAVEGEPASVKLLAELGAEVNSTNSYGDTPLHDCVALAEGEMVALLLSLGADPNKQNDRGQSALHVAFENEVSDSVFQMILKAGGDLRLKDNFGQTPEGV